MHVAWSYCCALHLEHLFLVWVSVLPPPSTPPEHTSNDFIVFTNLFQGSSHECIAWISVVSLFTMPLSVEMQCSADELFAIYVEKVN